MGPVHCVGDLMLACIVFSALGAQFVEGNADTGKIELSKRASLRIPWDMGLKEGYICVDDKEGVDYARPSSNKS